MWANRYVIPQPLAPHPAIAELVRLMQSHQGAFRGAGRKVALRERARIPAGKSPFGE
jgi:hypothetical protein